MLLPSARLLRVLGIGAKEDSVMIVKGIEVYYMFYPISSICDFKRHSPTF